MATASDARAVKSLNTSPPRRRRFVHIMGTPSDARAVKSHNKPFSHRRFVFKTFKQRLEEIDIDVYQSLEPLKAEPSQGSTFFRDCLVECRELNTAENFISFYEEMFPLVQSLRLIILQKEDIISKLLFRLKVENRLSHEPIMRLIAALSRDLLEDFIPFLQKLSDTLTYILESGADREAEIIEQVFTSWSHIMMYLQKYLVKDVDHVLRVTTNLRYYSRDYVREFMAESVSFILRNTSIQQLKKGISKIMLEVVKESSEIRKSGAAALLSHIVRITSSKLHSNAKTIMPQLVDDATFIEGPDIVLEVLILAFQRLRTELNYRDLTSIWKCLCGKITDCVKRENSSHLSRLLSLLISLMQNCHPGEPSDYKPVVELVGLLVETFVTVEPSEIIGKVLQLMLCVLDVINSENGEALLGVSSQWGLVFDLRSESLLNFIQDLLMKDPSIFHVFGPNIISALGNLLKIDEVKGVHLMILVSDKFKGLSNGDLQFLEGKINKVVEGDLSSTQFGQNELAVLWGVIKCYPHFADAQPFLLMDMINALDSRIASFPENTGQTLIGAALRSYHKIHVERNMTMNESAMTNFLDLAERYKTSPQILSAVADVFPTYKSKMQEHIGEKLVKALDIFAECLCHANKKIRVSALRILCHYEHLNYESANEIPTEKKMTLDGSETDHVDEPSNSVLNRLRSIEETPLSIISREVNELISKMHTSLSAGRVANEYVPVVLNGTIGIFRNRFSYLWPQASECLAVVLSQYSGIIWGRYIQYLEDCQSIFLKSRDQRAGSHGDSNEDTGLVRLFNSNVFPLYDSTPEATVLSLLIQSLQKVPSVVESHSRQAIPLFLKFLDYNFEHTSGASQKLDHKKKEWNVILKEWLNLFRLLRNPKAFYQSQVFKDVLQNRLLDENDADSQMRVLECLLNWRDDFLLPYGENLKRLINAKCLREELTKWSLSSKSMNPIDVQHRRNLVPIVIRILIPKVRNLKMLASQNARVHHRKAVIEFLAQLDVEELPLFFWLLVKPLLSSSQERNITSLSDLSSTILELFTVDTVTSISWKKRYGFLHVLGDILTVFDESHLEFFLDLLVNCVAQILASCASSLESTSSSGSSFVHNSSSSELNVAECDKVQDQIMERVDVLHFKDMKNVRSLCLKIIYMVLSKYKDHDFCSAFWDLFFASVKPLIDNFKRESASSEKPSSLFYCFLAMSKSPKLATLLFKDRNLKERKLVSDIFYILTDPLASESICACVLKFAKNLLKLDSDNSSIGRLLFRHLNVLMEGLRFIFSNYNASKRKLVKSLGKREITIFKLLSKYVKESAEARIFIDILLPLLAKRNKNFDMRAEILLIIQQVVTVLGTGSSKAILKAVTPLLSSAGSDVRTSVCDVLDALAANDSSVLTLANILRELNTTLEMEMDGLDYDKVICAYNKVDVEFFSTIPEEQALVILGHSINDMSSQELILRESARGLLLSFIDFSAHILNELPKSDLGWSESSIQHIVNNFLLKHMGSAMDKEPPVQKVWLEILRQMVLKLPKVADLDSYRPLCSDDADQDFFTNIVHLQKHRRARALSRFKNIANSRKLSEVITYKVFLPLFFHMLFDVQDGKDEHIRSASIDVLATISGCMEWNQYYALLNRCFRDLTLKSDKRKIWFRLICSILDHYHFSKPSLVQGAKVSASDAPDPYITDTASSLTLRRCSTSAELPAIQTCLQKNVLPKIQKLLNSDSDNINVNISLVALKLLKLLPAEVMDSQLPTIIHRISNFLKHRLESVREEARSALAACLKELGLEYLQFVVKVLKGTLKRGFELHVLGYTLNFILSKFLVNPICGKLDYCLDDLLSIIENDILGDVSEEKDVDKIASKMKETRKQKSYETLKLIAQSITFKTHALKLLSPVTKNLHKHQLNQKLKFKVENMLNHIASGIESNPSVDQTELFIFTYGLIFDGITDETNEHENEYMGHRKDERAPGTHTNRLINVDPRYSHLITTFALGVVQNYMKTLKLNKEDGQLVSLLDPFVKKLDQCLMSKYENVIIGALRCLSACVRLPLPSLQSHAEKIKSSLLNIAQGSVNASSQLTESCIKLLTILLQSKRVTLSDDQLLHLIEFPLFVDLAKNPSFVALSLFKAIVHRRLGGLVDHKINDLVLIVAKLMVQSQQETVRKKCSQILLQYLLGYHLSQKRLQQHLDFLLENLRYEHSTGREAVIEMLHTIIMKFPQNIVDELSQDMFLRLVVRLANDDDSKVRSMIAVALKCLFDQISHNPRLSILEYSQSWYLGTNQDLWAPAAQVLGLLVEVMGKGFQKKLSKILQTTRSILQSASGDLTNSQRVSSDDAIIPFWKEAYYSLVMFEKILHQFNNFFFEKDFEDIWEVICQFLLHPHLWLRSISNRILSLYFAAVTNAREANQKMAIDKFFFMKPSKLFLAAASFCSQLKVPLSDETACTLILQNLVFSICGLSSMLGNNPNMQVSAFWSSLEHAEQEDFLTAFGVLDSRKGKRLLAYFTSESGGQQNQYKHPFISYLLQRMGKNSFQMEASQMKIVFNCFKLISPSLLRCYRESSPAANDDLYSYPYLMLLPLYRVQEGYTGSVVTDDLKQYAQGASESIRDIIGMQNFVQVNNLIRKNLKVKRDKRKHEEKIMAVVNPMRNAKRKLRISTKHSANKKRKIITMKMGRWIR